MGRTHLSATFCHHPVINSRLAGLHTFNCLVYEPQAFVIRCMQVIRNSLTVRQPRNRQVVSDQGADHTAELPRLIDFGHDAACKWNLIKTPDSFVQSRFLTRSRTWRSSFCPLLMTT